MGGDASRMRRFTIQDLTLQTAFLPISAVRRSGTERFRPIGEFREWVLPLGREKVYPQRAAANR